MADEYPVHKKIEKVTLFALANGKARIEIRIEGNVLAYYEDFKDWARALEFLPGLVRDRVWEVVLGAEHANP